VVADTVVELCAGVIVVVASWAVVARAAKAAAVAQSAVLICVLFIY